MSKKFELKYQGDTFTFFGDDFETATRGNKLFKENKNKVKITDLPKKDRDALAKRELRAEALETFKEMLDQLDLAKLLKDYKKKKEA